MLSIDFWYEATRFGPRNVRILRPVGLHLQRRLHFKLFEGVLLGGNVAPLQPNDGGGPKADHHADFRRTYNSQGSFH